MLVKAPIPIPSFVVLLAVVGCRVVPYATPLEVTEAPPSAVIFPPVMAPVDVMTVADVVVTVGNDVDPPPVKLSFTQRTEKPLFRKSKNCRVMNL